MKVELKNKTVKRHTINMMMYCWMPVSQRYRG